MGHNAGLLHLRHGVLGNTNRQSLHLLDCYPFFLCDLLEGCHKFIVLVGITRLVKESLDGPVKEKRLRQEFVNTWHACHARMRGRPNRNMVMLLYIIQLLRALRVVNICCNWGKLLNQLLAFRKRATTSNNLGHTLPFPIRYFEALTAFIKENGGSCIFQEPKAIFHRGVELVHLEVYLLHVFREILDHLSGGIHYVANDSLCVLGEIEIIIGLDAVL
jgi:hypothetical protein